MPPFAVIALVLILARAIGELWLSRLNQRYVRAHANEVPPAFRAMVDEATYRRSVDYTLAKSRFGDVVTVFDVVLLVGDPFQRRVAVGVWKIHGSFRLFRVGDGWFSLHHRRRIEHREFAVRLVRAVQT